jgi:hypothetical protein
MIAVRPLAVLAVALFAIATGPGVAQANPLRHIDELSYQLERQIARLGREFNAHYRHTPNYRHLMNDARDMYRLAGHIHKIAHYEGDLHHIRHDLRDLDRLFHHIERLVGGTEGHAAHNPHTGGHVHGHTGHVFGLLADIERTLHHLMADVDRLSAPRGHHGPIGNDISRQRFTSDGGVVQGYTRNGRYRD